MDDPPCEPPEAPPEGMLDELPPDWPPEGMLEELPPERPDEPPELPELPPEEGGEPDGLGIELDEDCCSGQPPIRNTAAVPTATSLPKENRRLRAYFCIVTPSFPALPNAVPAPTVRRAG